MNKEEQKIYQEGINFGIDRDFYLTQYVINALIDDGRIDEDFIELFIEKSKYIMDNDLDGFYEYIEESEKDNEVEK